MDIASLGPGCSHSLGSFKSVAYGDRICVGYSTADGDSLAGPNSALTWVQSPI